MPVSEAGKAFNKVSGLLQDRKKKEQIKNKIKGVLMMYIGR
jgi:hypothetical protein